MISFSHGMVGCTELTSEQTREINNTEIFIFWTRELKLENVVRKGIHIVVPLLSGVRKPHTFRRLKLVVNKGNSDQMQTSLPWPISPRRSVHRSLSVEPSQTLRLHLFWIVLDRGQP
jgi:hypothetical protein